jgi:hypothetical protein
VEAINMHLAGWRETWVTRNRVHAWSSIPMVRLLWLHNNVFGSLKVWHVGPTDFSQENPCFLNFFAYGDQSWTHSAILLMNTQCYPIDQIYLYFPKCPINGL